MYKLYLQFLRLWDFMLILNPVHVDPLASVSNLYVGTCTCSASWCFNYVYLLIFQIGLFAKISLQNCPNLAVLLEDGKMTDRSCTIRVYSCYDGIYVCLWTSAIYKHVETTSLFPCFPKSCRFALHQWHAATHRLHTKKLSKKIGCFLPPPPPPTTTPTHPPD